MLYAGRNRPDRTEVPAAITRHLDAMSGVLPGGALDVIRDQLTRLAAQGSEILSISFVVGLVISTPNVRRLAHCKCGKDTMDTTVRSVSLPAAIGRPFNGKATQLTLPAPVTRLTRQKR
jgi:hypothetical protein